MSIYAFCCVNNKFNCLLVVFTTFWYSFFSSLPWRYVWTVESHNLLPFLTRFLFSCAVIFLYFRCLNLSVKWFSQSMRLWMQLFIYLFIFLFQDHFDPDSYQHPTLFISQLLLFDWYFIHQLLYFIIMRSAILDIFIEISFSQIIIPRKIIEKSFLFWTQNKHNFERKPFWHGKPKRNVRFIRFYPLSFLSSTSVEISLTINSPFHLHLHKVFLISRNH